MIKLSCCSANGYASICIIKDRVCVLKDVRPSISNGDRFDDSLNLFERAFYLLRAYIEKNEGVGSVITESESETTTSNKWLTDSSVVIESKNATFIKWLIRGYSTDKYDEKFYKVMEQLNQIPVEYSIIYESKPISLRFADKNYVTKVEVSKELDDVEEKEDNTTESLYLKPADTTKKLSGIEDLI